MSTRRSILTFCFIALAAIGTREAAAGVPHPGNSYVDPCVRVCPAGDMRFRVIVVDALSNPVSFATVVLDFCNCPLVVLCPTSGSDPYVVSGCLVSMNADAEGTVDIPIRAGGICMGGPVKVYAGGILFGTRLAVASPDQNGDASVGDADHGILAHKLGGAYDPTGDLNCSAALEGGDTGILNQHLGHSCNAVVPVLPRSWGRIKSIYR